MAVAVCCIPRPANEQHTGLVAWPPVTVTVVPSSAPSATPGGCCGYLGGCEWVGWVVCSNFDTLLGFLVGRGGGGGYDPAIMVD